MKRGFSQSFVCLLLVAAILALLPPKNSSGANLQVPSEYPTIQAAIDASSDGDIVLVADGIYRGDGNKQINFNGKAISVQSENGPENCIIDLEGEGRGFRFENGEGEDSVLSGFTIQGGDASVYASYDNKGGAIYIRVSSPSITNCIISSNQARSGAGLYIGWGARPELQIP